MRWYVPPLHPSASADSSGGGGGCVVAAQLAEKFPDLTVLLIERGGDNKEYKRLDSEWLKLLDADLRATRQLVLAVPGASFSYVLGPTPANDSSLDRECSSSTIGR